MPNSCDHRWGARCGLLAGVLGLTLLGVATDTGPLMLGGGTAQAVIGRPLTPMSYAGVARRTTRRAVYAGAATGAYASPYYAAPAVPSTTVVTTLPTGCAGGGGHYTCGAVQYQPVYSGTTVVYRRY
jgi:hypothetical protein